MFVDCCLPCSPIVTTERGGGNERRMRSLHKVILEVVFADIKATYFFKKATTTFRHIKEKKQLLKTPTLALCFYFVVVLIGVSYLDRAA